MGVRESHPRSKSILRRLKLSTTTTLWPRSERYNDVGQPQKPSPPNTRIYLDPSAAAPLAAKRAVWLTAVLGEGMWKDATEAKSDATTRNFIFLDSASFSNNSQQTMLSHTSRTKANTRDRCLDWFFSLAESGDDDGRENIHLPLDGRRNLKPGCHPWLVLIRCRPFLALPRVLGAYAMFFVSIRS